MKLGIVGTRGIPNHYGGFEQFAEFLSIGLVKRGHQVVVYNSHTHPYQKREFHQVQIVHKYDPEKWMGTAGQFFYDLNCIMDARRRELDALLNLGYTSSSVWSKLFPKKPVVLTNMDGLEWKRSKYSNRVKNFLKYAERLAVAHSNELIADSPAIKNYIWSKYRAPSTFIPYGANVFKNPDPTLLAPYGVEAGRFNMLIARMEPENNIEMILDGSRSANHHLPFLVIGNVSNSYGQKLVALFSDCPHIRFLGAIYEAPVIDNLRHFCNLYFHGHSVGGTNPSLLEAMGCGAPIAAHDNEFNRAVLGTDAIYFSSSSDIASTLNHSDNGPERFKKIKNNLQKIETTYAWSTIIDSYEATLLNSIDKHKRK